MAAGLIVYLLSEPEAPPAAKPPDGLASAEGIQPEGDVPFILSVEPTGSNVGHGIAPDAAFVLATRENISVEELEARLSLEPSVPFSVEQTAVHSYLLTSETPFEQDAIVRLTYDDGQSAPSRWAFQTQGVFRVVSTLPYGESAYVPVDTGIEITFSHGNIDAAALEPYFTVSPAVAGRFETHAATIVFVPSSPLDYDTVYTVGVGGGFTSRAGEALAESFFFSFRTQPEDANEWCYISGGVSETFLPDDQALVELRASSGYDDVSFSVTLYRYPSEEAYTEALSAYAADAGAVRWEEYYEFPTRGLARLSAYQDKLVRDGGDGSPAYLLLPAGLEEGHYLADITASLSGRAVHLQKQVQVSSLSVFAVSLSNASAFFVNDSLTGAPVSGAYLSLRVGARAETARTGADGTAQMEVRSDTYGRGVLVISSGDRVYQDLYEYRENKDRDPAEDYYTYLYTDRAAYLPTDTVRVWGVIRPKGNAPVPAALTLALGNSAEDRVSMPVTPGPNGAFTAEISLERRMTGGETVFLLSGEQILADTGLSVMDYVKPLYEMSASVPFYAVYPQTNPVTAEIAVSYYDKTPAPGIPLSLYSDSMKGAVTAALTTDASGKAAARVVMRDETSWRPAWKSVSVSTAGPENEWQETYAGFYALFRDTMLTASAQKDGSSGTVTVSVNRIDTGKIRSEEDLWYDNCETRLRGAAVSGETVTLRLHRIYFEKVETGSRYDYVEKQTVVEYRYDHREELVDTYLATLENGVCVFDGLPLADEDSWYRFELSCLDSHGLVTEETAYLYGRSEPYYFDRVEYLFDFPAYTFAEGEELTGVLLRNGEPVSGGRVFYTLSRGDFLSVGTAEPEQVGIETDTDTIPNAALCGAYFDGRRVWPVSARNLGFEADTRALSVEASADRESYAPGDKATVTVTVRDAEGKPVAGAAVNISVADEAALAVMPHDANPLGGIYRYIYAWDFGTYSSYRPRGGNYGGGAESGEGGDSQLRSDFRDTAAFLTGEADADGTAVFTVALPDNLTTWRATAQAIGPGMTAGQETAALVVSRPFFLVPVALSSYVAGDDVTVSARCAGKAAAGKDVKLTARLRGDGVDETVEKSGAQASFAFGALPEGSYILTLSANAGAYADALELPVYVVGSRLETGVSQTFDLAGGLSVEPARYPVTLGFYNQDYRLYGRVLGALYSHWSRRADNLIASDFAREKAPAAGGGSRADFSAFIRYDGGFSLLPYADSDAELTALVCAAAPEWLPAGRSTAAYLRGILSDRDSTPEQVCAAYMGLAALSEPVLLDIRALLDNPAGLSLRDRLRLVAGLAMLGDEGAAREHGKALLEGQVKTGGSPSGLEDWRFVSRAGDMNGRIADTAPVLLIAAALSRPEAHGYAAFLLDNASTEQSVSLELMYYLKHYPASGGEEAVFSYNRDGKRIRVSLPATDMAWLSFEKNALENADFKVEEGSVACTAYYRGRAADWATEPALSLTKTVVPVDGQIAVGALLKVTLSPRIQPGQPGGNYWVEDSIPSGARFTGSGSDYWNAVSRDGQNISCRYDYDPDNPSRNTDIVYFIRCVLPGRFVQEGAVIYHENGLWGRSEDGTLVIGE